MNVQRQSPDKPRSGSTAGISRPEPFSAIDLILVLKGMQAGIADAAEAHGLTIMQFYSLHAIGEEQKTNMGKTAEAIRCDASNVTAIVDKLVSINLVTRQENPEDRRMKTLQLTVKGRGLLRTIYDALPERLGYTRLTPTEIAEFRRLLNKLIGSGVSG